MSEFHVELYKLGKFIPHPNADSLDITKVFDYTVIAKRGQYKEGDLVVYVPIDAVVPDTEEWSWLIPRDHVTGEPRFKVGEVPEKYRVISAKRLRGIFSQGCLAPIPESLLKSCGDSLHHGLNVIDEMGITKYEPPEEIFNTRFGDCEAAPRDWDFVKYTDIEGNRRFPDILKKGEEVVITEKIHGCNARAAWVNDRLWVGSRTQIKKEDAKSVWWRALKIFEKNFSQAPRHIFFGEVFGSVQDLKYGLPNSVSFECFDVYNIDQQCFLDHDDAQALAQSIDLKWVPIFYRGPWDEKLNELCEGQSTIPGANNVREGIVIKPTKERWDEEIGRVILKRHGEGYLLRKKK